MDVNIICLKINASLITLYPLTDTKRRLLEDVCLLEIQNVLFMINWESNFAMLTFSKIEWTYLKKGRTYIDEQNDGEKHKYNFNTSKFRIF